MWTPLGLWKSMPVLPTNRQPAAILGGGEPHPQLAAHASPIQEAVICTFQVAVSSVSMIHLVAFMGFFYSCAASGVLGPRFLMNGRTYPHIPSTGSHHAQQAMPL
mmetsp:Transcript_45356/g.82855  ORF Transcript_45356/g.82855 Transcript_45356/m.82855 type:complete len:105 (+) Transcript_45356:1131-1445(+)